jgi:hypothetical protein
LGLTAGPGGHVPGDDAPGRWRILALLSAAELLGMSLWFAGSAVAPMLRTAWSLSDAQVGWLTTAVQLGFVAGTAIAALLNLPDVIPSRTLFATSAVAGAVANLGLAYTTSPPLAFVSRPGSVRGAASRSARSLAP